MEIKIIRSLRRTRTVSARLLNDTLLVRAPFTLSEQRLRKIIVDFKRRFNRKKLKDEVNAKENLSQMAASLNARYFDNVLMINSIEYVTDQRSKFGCCNYVTSSIRISHKVSTMPEWVRKYVLMHEMAHLMEPNHSKSFWDIVSRYPLTERARGYLIALGLESSLE